MSTSTMLVFLGVLGVTSLLCNSSAWLWLASKWCRIPNVSFLRAVGAMLLIGVVNLPIQIAVQRLGDWIGGNVTRSFAVLGLALCVIFAAMSIILRFVLRTTFFRAASAGLISALISGVVAVPVILAVRGFLMESFVLPTGSMALALLGRHFDVTCERCGWTMAVSANERFQMQNSARGLRTAGFVTRPNANQISKCANCNNETAVPADRPIMDGDRILVDKLGHARRWDLVVFRYPSEIDTNYVKRLVGLPGETVEIIGGDVFINGRREAKPFGVASEMWIHVNDTRFSPRESGPQQPQWRPTEESSHWRWCETGWNFSGAAVGPEKLVYSGALTDESYYFERWADETVPFAAGEVQPVGDVQVTISMRHFAGPGTFGVGWAFRGLRADVRLSADGAVELRSASESQQTQLAKPMAAVCDVSFAVRDGAVMLIADGRVVASLPVGPQEADSVRELRENLDENCQLAFVADHCELDIARIVIERDVHYRGDQPPCHGCTGQPIVLGHAEHYVLGDHSQRANDSRFWKSTDERLHGRYQVGAVPEELMIGVARCVYWPPSRWHEFR